ADWNRGQGRVVRTNGRKLVWSQDRAGIANVSGVSSRVWWRVCPVRSLVLLVSVWTFACILHDTKLLRLLRVDRVATISCGGFGAVGTKLAFPGSSRSIKPKAASEYSGSPGVTARSHVGGVFMVGDRGCVFRPGAECVRVPPLFALASCN
ncbi:unnamed protein product, partial [Ectocarpus sp. 12 AP-2014]